MPPPWIPARNKGKTKANKLVSREVENKIFISFFSKYFYSNVYLVLDTMLGSGNTTCGLCSQEAGKEKHLNKYLHKIY